MADMSQENISEVVNDGLQEKEIDDVPCMSSQPPKKKKKPNLVDQRLDEAFEILKRPYPTTTAPDDWSIYGQHVANKLRGYSKQTSSIVQHLINNIIFEADMGKHDANPYQFIQPSQHFSYQNSPLSSTSYFHTPQHSFTLSSHSHSPVPSLSTEIPYDSPSTSNNINIQASEYMGTTDQENHFNTN